MLLGLRTVVYKVDDLEKAKRWYAELTGVEPYFEEPFYVGFNIGGYELGLDPDSDGAVRGDSPMAYWGVENIDEAFARAIGLGAGPVTDVTDVGGGIRVATIRDPFENQIGLIENPHFKVGS